MADAHVWEIKSTFWASLFNFLTMCLTKDHWWGVSTHMVQIVNYIQFKMVYTSK